MKTKTKKRYFSAVLLCVLICLPLAMFSCADSKDAPPDTTEDNGTGEVTTQPPELGVPTDKDYGGYTFTLNSYSHSAYITEHLAEELTGDLMNDAVYERNARVEDLFNIKINVVIGVWGNDECRSLISRSVLAGDDDYDMFTGNTYNMTFLSSEGYFKRISDVPYIDHEKPWWNQYAYREFSVGQNAYLMSGDIAMSNYAVDCVFFNKKYIKDYQLQDPYQLVYEDKWTMGKLIAMTKDFYVDLNGNGIRDAAYESSDGETMLTDDLYGMYTAKASIYAIVNHWVPITSKNADNYPEVTFYSERTATMFDEMKEYFLNSAGSLCSDGWTDHGLFNNGGSVFVFSNTHRTSYAATRQTDTDYGIVPVPKYDANQKDYRTCGGGLMVAVPVTSNNPERTGMVMEALAYYGKQFVYPAYLEKTIMQKGTRDTDAQAMLEIILNSVYYNFGVAFSGFQGYGYALLEYFKTTKGFASFYESMEHKATAELINYADKILALEQ